MTLADKIEQASEGSRELDAEIEIAVFGDDRWAKSDPRPFTTSLDAALMLAPEGIEYQITRYGDTGGGFCELYSGRDLDVSANGATPALAICAASLRARKETDE